MGNTLEHIKREKQLKAVNVISSKYVLINMKNV